LVPLFKAALSLLQQSYLEDLDGFFLHLMRYFSAINPCGYGDGNSSGVRTSWKS
jgi:hypothetical protein